jgi:hypothetical protein
LIFGKLYPRMYLGVVAGLIDGRHHRRLGAAWMLFEWCIMRQTGQGQEGIVCRGATITYGQIAEEMNCSSANVRKWMRRLIQQKYIRFERERYGFRLFILNPKKIRVSTLEQPGSVQGVQSRPSGMSTDEQSKGTHSIDKSSTSENLLQNNLTKLLKNYNSASLADARSILFSIPEEMGQTLRERQTQETTLLGQKEKLLTVQRFQAEKAEAELAFAELAKKLGLGVAAAR